MKIDINTCVLLEVEDPGATELVDVFHEVLTKAADIRSGNLRENVKLLIQGKVFELKLDTTISSLMKEYRCAWPQVANR